MRMIDRRSLLIGVGATVVVSPVRAAEPMTPEEWAGSAITAIRFRAKGVPQRRFNMMTSTMAPTIARGDILVADIRRPVAAVRGDIVAVRHGGKDYLKRIIGLPGERVALRGARPIIDGNEAEWQPEGTIRADFAGREKEMRVVVERLPGARPHRIALETTSVPERPSDDFVVPEGHVWLLGDTRDRTLDSRASEWGPRPLADVLGRVFYRAHPRPGFLVPPETVPGLEDE